MTKVQLRIARIVWHGPGQPDAARLAAALQTALQEALGSQAAREPRPAAADATQAWGHAVAAQLAPRLRAAGTQHHG